MKNITFILITCVMIMAPAIAQAGDGGGYQKKLDNLRSENALLKMEVSNAKLHAQLDAVNATPPGGETPSFGASSSSGGSNSGSHQSNASQQKQKAPAPILQVITVTGFRKNLTAVLQFTNGRTITATKGTDIPGIGVIRSINGDRVVLMTHDGKRWSVPFAKQAVDTMAADTGSTQQTSHP